MSDASSDPSASTTTSSPASTYNAQSQHPTWSHTMIRIKDVKRSVEFYKKHFGFELVHSYSFDELRFSLSFLAILPPGVAAPKTVPSRDSEAFLWSYTGTVLELTHNYGDEARDELRFNNGNVEPHRGFGHLALMCNDVYAACDALERDGVAFQKKPDDGRMKGLAFALDPDGYWLEIIRRADAPADDDHSDAARAARTLRAGPPFNLAQTMLRVRDVQRSLEFYQRAFALAVVSERHFEQAAFSLYFLATLDDAERAARAADPNVPIDMRTRFAPVLELTHNHGTEKQPDFRYHSGNAEPKGFGHIAFLVDDLDAAAAGIAAAFPDARWVKRPSDGAMRGIAFVEDPDGYWVELVQRGVSFAEHIAEAK